MQDHQATADVVVRDVAPAKAGFTVQVAQRTDDRSSVFRTFEFARLTFYADSTRRTPAGQRRRNSKSPWDRAYPLTQLPTPRRAAIAALNYAAVAIEFSRAIIKPRLGVDLIEIAGDH